MSRAQRKKVYQLANRKGKTEVLKDSEARITVDCRVLYPEDADLAVVLTQLESAYFSLRKKIGIESK